MYSGLLKPDRSATLPTGGEAVFIEGHADGDLAAIVAFLLVLAMLGLGVLGANAFEMKIGGQPVLLDGMLTEETAAWVVHVASLAKRSKGATRSVGGTVVDGVLPDQIQTEYVVGLGPQLVAMKAWDALGFTPMSPTLMTISTVDHVWCTDITYVPMPGGHACLCAVMDWHFLPGVDGRGSGTFEPVDGGGVAGDLFNRPWRLPGRSLLLQPGGIHRR